MNHLLRGCGIGLLLMLAVAGRLWAVAEPSADDAAWKALLAGGFFRLYEQPANASALTGRARAEWREARLLWLRDQGRAFIAAHPDDPRRWAVALQLLEIAPAFITAYGPDFETNYGDRVIDESAMADWKKEQAELEQAMLAATDVTKPVRTRLDILRVNRMTTQVRVATEQGQPVDWARAVAEIEALAAKYPENKALAGVVRNFMYVFDGASSPVKSAEVWQRFAAGPNKSVAEQAATKAGFFALVRDPIELTFTAVDGRSVDLAQLRGKVVLLDFWATWCGPCIAEFPHLKKVYAEYQAQGFEVVGIALELARVTPNDSPEQAAAKIAAAKKKLLHFAAKQQLPWPHHYDGIEDAAGGNPLVRRFSVTAIPAAFLLDQTGRIVGMNLRGAALEQAVKRLLSGETQKSDPVSVEPVSDRLQGPGEMAGPKPTLLEGDEL